ncbi:CAP domain-containing protein [Massilia sp. BJB1822]|uniref:CAP domain-containing protein n=1 Tax=Massilia sp. BJB1822 TaxID=2744470 RepID=UPI001594C6E8|nr:CAP domain-containing protein [Massilia sp. BJB1822]NVD97123.1 hypothetical protein [Massilia sp. BJB1822]
MKHIKQTLVTSAVAVLLAACGGGGGSSPSGSSAVTTPTPPVTPTTPTTPVVIPGNLQTTVPALTYSAASEEFRFVTAFNDFRRKLGLGLLVQNSSLDKAADSHLQYVLANDVNTGGTVNMGGFDPVSGRPMFHVETIGKQLFTGVYELDRAKAAGYTGIYVGESGTFGGGKGADVAFETLVKTIYHRAGLMFQGPTDVGIAVGKNRSQTFVLEFGFKKEQYNASDYLGVYPTDNQTAVGLHTGVETPNPFPELSTSNADFPTKTGYPVSVLSKEGTTLEVITFTLTEAGASAPLEVRIMTRDNDPLRHLQSNIAFLVARAPLKPNTIYSAVFSGRVNNVVVNKMWKFTTDN